ncbi:YidC/Oxa1 family membrane protein insertase [bacterium]|nr:YidC/Oxa1 family membrane protein insertase [bacterium]MBO6072066.1 YidC/Oxa1 family membrane protein insertase [bacterium]MBO7043720.1 YidC/Oxa1 family membrane protein insertase [bacterium]
MRGAWGGLNALLAIIILLAIIRTISIVVSIRSAVMTEKMQELNAQITAIKEKYKGARDQQSKQMQQQEIQQVYKKNNVRQTVMLEQVVITLPVFLIIYRVVTILRPFKYTVLFNIWNLSDSPYNQIFQYFTENG